MENRRIKILFLVIIAFILAFILYRFFAPRFAGEISVNPIMFQIGPLALRWYGAIIAISVACAYGLWLLPIIKRNNYNEDEFTTLALLLVITGIIGARLGYVVQNLHYYLSQPVEILALWHGGMSIHGAVIACIPVVIWRAPKVGLPAMKLLDILSPAVVLCLAFGRLGNFFNGELFGKPTDVAWKMFVPAANRPLALSQDQYFHPVFLYEMVLDLLIFIALIFIGKKFGRNGIVFWSFVLLYSAARFTVEFWRYNEGFYWWGFSLAQWVSMILMVISVVALYIIFKVKGLTKRNNSL